MTAKKPIRRVQREAARRATAWHEAGHAVVHHHFGLPSTIVTIVPDKEDGSLGHHEHPGILCLDLDGSRREQRSVARQMIIGCYAGLAAQKLVDPRPAAFHGERDNELAFELSCKWGAMPRGGYVGDEAHLEYLERLRGEARRLVGRLRPTIARIAEALLEHGTLTGDQLERFIEAETEK